MLCRLLKMSIKRKIAHKAIHYTKEIAKDKAKKHLVKRGIDGRNINIK